MKIIIDECLPKRLIQFFPEHKAWTVPQIGLAGYKDSILLEELDKRDIDLFVTIDGNIEYQQQFLHRGFATIIIRAVSNRFSDLENLKPRLTDTLKDIKPGCIIHIS